MSSIIRYRASPNLTIKQVEIDFGGLPVDGTLFTIEDSSVTLDSLIVASVAYDAPTDKDLDEITMDNLIIRCGNCSIGSFEMFIDTADGSYLADKFKINYIIN
tara:strand:+ start:569 stop:877 length:309 start_codon:yes stop_codon:yes gene_type:complete